MNYRDFNLGDWIGHISGVIEDETTLDGNEMRDLVEFLTTLKQEPILDKIRAEIKSIEHYCTDNGHDFWFRTPDEIKKDVLKILDKYKAESEVKENG